MYADLVSTVNVFHILRSIPCVVRKVNDVQLTLYSMNETHFIREHL